MNVLYLGEQDFYVDKGTKGNVICSTQKGINFVMFHADPGICQYCDIAKPEFVQLSHIVPGAKYGLCNLSRARGLVDKSFQTITPLNKVPLFILFVNGRPFMNYTGEKTVKHFAEFMQNAMQRLQQQQVFSQTGQPAPVSAEQTEKTPHGIAYDYDYVTVTNPSLIGSVTCNDEGVCYLTAKESGLQPEPKAQPPPQQPAYQPQRPYQPPQQPQQVYQPQYVAQQPYYPPAQPTNPMMTQAQQQYIPGQPQYYQAQQQFQPQYTPQYQPQYQQQVYQPQQYQYQPQQQQKPFY